MTVGEVQLRADLLRLRNQCVQASNRGERLVDLQKLIKRLEEILDGRGSND